MREFQSCIVKEMNECMNNLIRFSQKHVVGLIHPFVPSFLMFSGVEKGCIGNEWVK